VIAAVGCSSSHHDARPSLECGEGTVAEDGKCVVARGGSGDGGATSDLVCGPGTVLVGNACVPDDGGQGGTDHPGGGSGGQATTGRGGDDGSVAGAGLAIARASLQFWKSHVASSTLPPNRDSGGSAGVPLLSGERAPARTASRAPVCRAFTLLPVGRAHEPRPEQPST
jgi:hypothetical protein